MVFTIKTEIIGLDKQLERFDPEKFVRVKSDLTKIELEEMQTAVVIARSLAPVKTGTLRDSIEIKEFNEAEMSVVGGTSVRYARFVEFGTVKMHARPFWRPPVWEAFYRARRRIREYWRKTIG